MSLVGSFIFYSGLHTFINYISENVNEQRTVVGLMNSIGLSSMVAYPFYLMYIQPYQAINTVLLLPHMKLLSDILIGHFTTDLVIGHLFDRKKMDLLEGYIHHTLYAMVVTYMRYTQETNIILLYLPFEIPTVFLNLNRFNKSREYNLHFGISFVLFRILYNIYLIQIIGQYNVYYTSLTYLMLAVHSFWFYKWCKGFVAAKRAIAV